MSHDKKDFISGEGTSDCCDAEVWSGGICSFCKEHCEIIPDDPEEKEELADESQGWRAPREATDGALERKNMKDQKQEDDRIMEGALRMLAQADRMHRLTDRQLAARFVDEVWGQLVLGSDPEGLADELITRFEKLSGIERDDEGRIKKPKWHGSYEDGPFDPEKHSI